MLDAGVHSDIDCGSFQLLAQKHVCFSDPEMNIINSTLLISDLIFFVNEIPFHCLSLLKCNSAFRLNSSMRRSCPLPSSRGDSERSVILTGSSLDRRESEGFTPPFL